MARRKNRMDNHDKLLMLWSLSKFNDAVENYRTINRNYCLGKAKWGEVEAARREAHRCGVGDEKLLSVDIDVMNSITEEEVMKAIYG